MYISIEDERTMMLLVAILLVGTRRLQKDIDNAMELAATIFAMVQAKSEPL